MTKYPDLDYDLDSFAGVFQDDELSGLQEYLHRTGLPRITFDPVYIDYLRGFHGGAPRKRYFKTAQGTHHVIERFLNFASPNDLLSEYNVNVTWSALCDRLGDDLMPFAVLFAGDYLCSDHSGSGRAHVAVWFHEESPVDSPHTEHVADSFEAFLALLSSQDAASVGSSLPDELEDRIFRLCCDGNDFVQDEAIAIFDNSVERAVECYQSAAALLPEPRLQWTIAFDVFFGLGEARYVAASFALAIEAFELAQRAPRSTSTPYLPLRLGQCYFEIGDMRQAAFYLRQAFQQHARLFEDVDNKYLAFVRNTGLADGAGS